MNGIIEVLEAEVARSAGIRGSQKMGIGSHWWDGRIGGLQYAIHLLEDVSNDVANKCQKTATKRGSAKCLTP